MSNLKGKKIVLGITGGIAAYKSAILLRLFVKAGAEVQVIMTPNAKEFIAPVTMSTLSGKPVISEFFTSNTGQWNSHVDLGLWADAMVIAPATASSIAKMATGVADNMLITSYLSTKAPVFVAPAMDLDMFKHPTTCHNIELLKKYGNHIIEPASGELASHLVGKGRMEEPEKIVEVLDDYFSKTADLKGKKVLITAGPTYEKIDPVRFIGNFSSGKMGFALAEECLSRGAEVTLVAGPVERDCSSAISRIDVVSAQEMLDAVLANFDGCDVAIMCAAVADYGVANYSNSKIKRENGDVPEIKLKKNKDIAKTIGERKQPGQVTIGFALETDNEQINALSKLESKNLDMIVLNSMQNPKSTFNSDNNTITIFERNGKKIDFTNKSKTLVARDIVDTLVSDVLVP